MGVERRSLKINHPEENSGWWVRVDITQPDKCIILFHCISSEVIVACSQLLLACYFNTVTELFSTEWKNKTSE